MNGNDENFLVEFGLREGWVKVRISGEENNEFYVRIAVWLKGALGNKSLYLPWDL
jgi:hypothetical protein